jgi:hypothetical protein
MSRNNNRNQPEDTDAATALAESPFFVDPDEAPKASKREPVEPVYVYVGDPSIALLYRELIPIKDQFGREVKKIGDTGVLNLTTHIEHIIDKAAFPHIFDALKNRAETSRDIVLARAKLPESVLEPWRQKINGIREGFNAPDTLDSAEVHKLRGRLKPVYAEFLAAVKAHFKKG